MRKVLLFLLFASASFAAAQPMPQPPFPEPIAGVVGRYGPATGRSYASSSLGLIAFVRGLTSVDVYRLATFPARIATSGGTRPSADFTIDPSAPGSGWTGAGFQSFDSVIFDERGYVIVGFGTIVGLGILDTSGHLIKQLAGVYWPSLVFESGGHPYLLAQNSTGSVIYDITNPATPTLARQLAFRSFSAAQANGDIALITDTGVLQFFTTAALLAGDPPFQSGPAETFQHVVSNGSDFFTLSFGAPVTTLVTSIFVKGGGTFTRSSSIPLPNHLAIGLRYDSGYVVASASTSDNSLAPRGAIFTLDGDTLVLHDVGPFMQQTYGQSFGEGELSLTPFQTGGREYLTADMSVTSDLFILTDPNAIPATSAWALIVLGAMLAALAVVRMKT